MPYKITSWIKVATGLQFLTAAVHSISLVHGPQGQNEMERQMIDLMYNYQMDMGAGIQRSMGDLFTGLSSCFTLIYLLGALINLYLIRSHAPHVFAKGIVGVQIIIFALAFLVMVFFTFLPPIICTGMVLLFLVMSYFRLTPAKPLISI